jgi:hypothetical protein
MIEAEKSFAPPTEVGGGDFNSLLFVVQNHFTTETSSVGSKQ